MSQYGDKDGFNYIWAAMAFFIFTVSIAVGVFWGILLYELVLR